MNRRHIPKRGKGRGNTGVGEDLRLRKGNDAHPIGFMESANHLVRDQPFDHGSSVHVILQENMMRFIPTGKSANGLSSDMKISIWVYGSFYAPDKSIEIQNRNPALTGSSLDSLIRSQDGIRDPLAFQGIRISLLVDRR